MAAITTTGTATSAPDTVTATGTLSGTATGMDYFGTGAEFQLDIDFTKGGRQTPTGFTSGLETRIREVVITRGRSSERDTFQVGTFAAVLDNRDRYFDPEYTGGTHYGDLLPMRWLRFQMLYDSTTYPMFFGHIQGFPQTWEISDTDCTVTLVAHDPMKLAGVATSPESEWAASPSLWPGVAWYRLGEETGATYLVDSRDPSDTTSWGQYGDQVTTLTDGLIAYSTNGARNIVGTSKPDGGLIATGLKGFPAGTACAVECWVRFPSTSTGNARQYLWCQGQRPFGMQWTGGVGETFPNPDSNAPYMMLWIDSNSQRLNFAWYNGVNFVTEGYTTVSQCYDDEPHQIAFERDSSTIRLYVDGVSQGITTTTGGTIGTGSYDFGSTAFVGPFHEGTWDLDEIGVWTGSLGTSYFAARYTRATAPALGDTIDARIDRINDATLISPLGVNLETSTVTCQSLDYGGGSNNLLGMLRQLEETEIGRVFYGPDGVLQFHNRTHDIGATIAAAFTDDPGSTLPYAQAEHEFDDVRVINEATVTRDNGTPQTYSDSTSITTYGRRPGSPGASLVYRTDTESLAHAQYLANRYKDPRGRIRSLVVKPRSKPFTLIPVVGALDIGDLVTFERNVSGGTAFTYTLTIEGIQHRITARGEWTVTYLTAPAVTDIGRWDEGLWDEAKWGL